MHKHLDHDYSGRGGGAVGALQAESLMFESQPQQTQFVKAGSESSTVERSAKGVCFTGPRRWQF